MALLNSEFGSPTTIMYVRKWWTLPFLLHSNLLCSCSSAKHIARGLARQMSIRQGNQSTECAECEYRIPSTK
jgi:hypothetical protein